MPIFLLPRNSHEISGGNSSQHTNILVSPIGGIDLQMGGKMGLILGGGEFQAKMKNVLLILKDWNHPRAH